MVKIGINQLKIIPITAKTKPGILSNSPPMIKAIDLKIKIRKNAREIF